MDLPSPLFSPTALRCRSFGRATRAPHGGAPGSAGWVPPFGWVYGEIRRKPPLSKGVQKIGIMQVSMCQKGFGAPKWRVSLWFKSAPKGNTTTNTPTTTNRNMTKTSTNTNTNTSTSMRTSANVNTPKGHRQTFYIRECSWIDLCLDFLTSVRLSLPLVLLCLCSRHFGA